MAHVQEKPIPPSRRSELDIPGALEEIILACLEKDPADRPQTASELDRLLAECGLDGEWSGKKAQEWWALHLPEIVLHSPAEAFEEREATILTVRQ